MSTNKRVERAEKVRARLDSEYGQDILKEPRPTFGLEFVTGVSEFDEEGDGMVGASVVDSSKIALAFLAVYDPTHLVTMRAMGEAEFSGEEIVDWSRRTVEEGLRQLDPRHLRYHRALVYFLTFAPDKLSGAVASLFEEAKAWALSNVDGDEAGARAMLDEALGAERKAAVDRLMLRGRGRANAVTRDDVRRAFLWLYERRRDLTQANVIKFLAEAPDGGEVVRVTERSLSAYARPHGILRRMDGWDAEVEDFKAEMAHRARLRAEQETPVEAEGSDAEH